MILMILMILIMMMTMLNNWPEQRGEGCYWRQRHKPEESRGDKYSSLRFKESHRCDLWSLWGTKNWSKDEIWGILFPYLTHQKQSKVRGSSKFIFGGFIFFICGHKHDDVCLCYLQNTCMPHSRREQNGPGRGISSTAVIDVLSQEEKCRQYFNIVMLAYWPRTNSLILCGKF